MHLWIGCMVIRASRDQRAFDHFPGLIAVFHALHRLLAPRHPPHALSSLAALIVASIRGRPPIPRPRSRPRHLAKSPPTYVGGSLLEARFWRLAFAFAKTNLAFCNEYDPILLLKPLPEIRKTIST